MHDLPKNSNSRSFHFFLIFFCFWKMKVIFEPKLLSFDKRWSEILWRELEQMEKINFPNKTFPTSPHQSQNISSMYPKQIRYHPIRFMNKRFFFKFSSLYKKNLNSHDLLSIHQSSLETFLFFFMLLSLFFSTPTMKPDWRVSKSLEKTLNPDKWMTIWWTVCEQFMTLFLPLPFFCIGWSWDKLKKMKRFFLGKKCHLNFTYFSLHSNSLRFFASESSTYVDKVPSKLSS